MKNYWCWIPDDGPETDGEMYARWAFAQEVFDAIAIHVRSPSGRVRAFDVDAEMEPTIHVTPGFVVSEPKASAADAKEPSHG